MQIKDILNIENAKLISGNENEYLTNISKDTRTIKENETYLGITGENFNGSEYYLEALNKGAKTCILSDIVLDPTTIEKYSDRNIIICNDTVELIKKLAIKIRSNLKVPIIAVTGSVGKTSTRNIITEVLSSKYKVLKTSGNLNTDIGLALTLMNYTDEEAIVLEMGMNHFGEISTLTNIAKPDVAVITNIGTAHIGILGSRENILKAKLEILEGLNGPIIINNDNDLLSAWYQNNKISNKIITFGIENKSDYEAENITYDKTGSHFFVNNHNVDINVIGKHFIYNSLVSFAIADLFNININDVINKLKHIPLEENRMQLITNDSITIINDTYNASYDSIYYALEVLSSFRTRKIAVLGDILELGDYAIDIHKKIGELIVKNKIDILITVGELSKYINEEAEKNKFNINNTHHFKSNKDAIDFINSIKGENDTILVKASNSMNFIEIVKEINN